jgi:hypothetical protein
VEKHETTIIIMQQRREADELEQAEEHRQLTVVDSTIGEMISGELCRRGQ